MAGQKGPKTVRTLGVPRPTDKLDLANQKEVGRPRAFVLDQEGMPKVSLETNRMGQTMSMDINDNKHPLRQPMEVKIPNPDTNLGTQWIKPNEVEHTPGAFNK